MLFQAGSTASMGCRIDQMEASVAPPRLTTLALPARRRILPGRSRGIQSPLCSARRSDGGGAASLPAAYSVSICISAGAEFPQGDVFAVHQRQPVGRVLEFVGVGHDQGAAGGQGAEDVVHREVEAEAG